MEPLYEEWMAQAECTGTSSEVFFDEDYVRLAKKICACCEVREECLDYAYLTKQRDGVWGGLTAKERKRLRASA